MQNKKSKPGILLPPAVGYSLSLFLKLLRQNKVSPSYYLRIVAIVLINLVNTPFRAFERKYINPRFSTAKIENDPVFIIGHWRSGTTHLHNILCRDNRFGYTTTYQSVFPDTLFGIAGRGLFRFFTKVLIPGKREGDNVQLNADFPQEEEFALGDKTPLCFYYFWMFPHGMADFYDTSVRFLNVPNDRKEKWLSDYKLLIKKALKNTSGQIYLSKNPPNTGRIKELTMMFPNAKFIHIHRNPVEVFLSTRNFYEKMMPHLQLQKIKPEKVIDSIIFTYKSIMDDFMEAKNLIPEGNIVEVSYNELESTPLKLLEGIYNKLDISGFEDIKPVFERYLKQSKGYKKNDHTITSSMLSRLKNNWGYIMKRYEYDIPSNLIITDR